ncbi:MULTISPECIES: hypothetical protein [Bacillales]|uniref:hypothetical protein n=1 Tax=Bacillales TaxID=1385 RepID=UPI000542D5CA|nr:MULTISPECIES: hypothetical protein [Bacillales]KHF30131.1 hypothetical protein LR68_01258 [Anoxybacillus sp. BCO1]MED0688026.1 hypothetical protein [Anoxybacillus ayderensis]NNU96200.1 hypothetical protein [Anoxybacillus sp. EFIL]NNV04655.1 hypothetical protein [Brevibacillus sp. MCWH]
MKVSIQFKNAEEFQQLLERAVTLLEQLQETLQRINEFEMEFEAYTKPSKTINVTKDVKIKFPEPLSKERIQELAKPFISRHE